MRTDSTTFYQYNSAASQEPIFVVEVAFDEAGTDVIYLTSHPVEGLLGDVFESVLSDISGTTQKINPDKALSEIGALSFAALDEGLTEKQRGKLNSGLGLRGKRARFYVGFRTMDWSEYTLVQTQIINGASYKDLVYSWQCSDIQREMRKNVFEVKSTALARTLEPGDTEVEVYSTADFEMVKQPPSPSGKTDAPGQKVGYIILEDDGKKEVIRYTGITPTKFTGCTRGVLGTRPIRVEKSENEGADNAPKVTEYVYLEMPAPMLAYAILTGSIYSEPGETLPEHWHLGIAPQYIRTADYTGIGEDLWDLSSPDNGLPARIAGVADKDGKQFVEEELFLLMGCYAPIYANGEIGLRRMTGVLSGASAIRILSDRNVTGYSSLKHDMSAIINRIVIAWNWVDQREEFTRTNLLIDQHSIDMHGDADLKQLEFRALHGSRHSYSTLRSLFDALRDRYAGPPLRLSLDLMPDQNDLEVGDIVRVQLAEVEDYTGEVSGIDRAFEVQQVKVNWKTGAVSVELFGSSQKAEPLPLEQPGASLPDAVYQVSGATEISPANFPGKVTESGGITTITGNLNLSGSSDLRSPSAIYYCMQDLTINAGVTVTINNNTQIRVKGFFQINGKIDGRGRGLSGGAGMTFSPTPGLPGLAQKLAAVYPPKKGFVGASVPAGGYYNGSGYYANSTITSKFASDGRLQGLYSEAPPLSLEVVGESIHGLPSLLCGQPGAGGGSAVSQGNRYDDIGYAHNPQVDGPHAKAIYRDPISGGRHYYYDKFWAAGGAGGKSGAGLFVLCSGAEFGAAGALDLSGAGGSYGATGVINSAHGGSRDWDHGKTVHGGRGAPGAPGCAYWAVVGPTSNPPTLTSANSIFQYGSNAFAPGTTPIPVSSPKDFAPIPWEKNNFTIDKPGLNIPGPGNHLSEHTRIQILSGEIAPEPDVPEWSDKPAAITATEALNTPKTPNANISTLEVSVTAPADPAYSHALVEYRPKGSEGWANAGPASPEALITVASDGTVYELRARSVSKSGLVSDDYVEAEIATTKIVGAQPGDPDVDDKIVVPSVRGLELENQGNETDFTGRDAKFVWRPTTIGQWFELGSEGQLGASASELDLYFRDYQVEVWVQNKIVRTEWVTDPAYIYSYEKNAEDYARENLSPGAWRAFELRVYCRGRLNQVSKQPAVLAVQNPAPNGVLGLSVAPNFNSIEISYQRPDDLDFAGVQVWVSEVPGFDPDAVAPSAKASDNSIAISGLSQGRDYYVRIRPFDDFGPTGVAPSPEIKVTTKTGVDVEGLGGWAYQIDPADRAFIEQHLASNAVPSQKIASLTAAKVTTGTLNATETITAEGLIRAVDDANNPQVQVGLGPATFNAKSYLHWAYNGQKLVFGVDDQGNVELTGSITIAAGSSGISNLSDAGALASKDKAASSDVSFNYAGSSTKGGSAADTENVAGESASTVKDKANAGATFTSSDAGGLAYKNTADWSTEVTGAGKPESGATVGADWNSTLSNIPERISDQASVGLNLTATYMGYYDGTNWGSYIQSDGSFHFGGQGDNFIDWNGSKLAINTDNLVVDPAGNATFSGELSAATGIFGDTNNNVTFDGVNFTINTPNLNVDENGNVSITGTMTGGLIQTDTSGRRVVIDGQTNNLSVYNASNKKLIDFGESVVIDGQARTPSLYVAGDDANDQPAVYITSQAKNGLIVEMTDSLSVSAQAAYFKNNGGSHSAITAFNDNGAFSNLGAIYGVGNASYGVMGRTLNGPYDFYAAGSGAYGPFTGAHDGLLELSQAPSIGDILVADGRVEKNGVGNTMPYLERASRPRSKAAYGIYTSSFGLETGRPATLESKSAEAFEAIKSRYKRVIVNAVGEGQINVCSESGDFEVGDFICTSSLPGKGMRYDGQDMRHVVAKCMEPVKWDDEPSNIKMVACIYMCG